jgi:hypothetical protein
VANEPNSNDPPIRASASTEPRVADYLAAVEAYVRAAEGVPGGRWGEPRAPGKWSPEQITVHVTLAYEGLLRELVEGRPMAIRTKWWQRIVLRRVVLPRFLEGVVPPGAPAPRETRPDEILESGAQGSRAECLARLERSAADFLDALLRTRAVRPRARLTHPYFGALGLNEVLVFLSVHTTHHRRQIEEVSRG